MRGTAEPERVVLRPHWLRIVGWTLSIALAAFSVGGWFAFPADVRARVTPFQLITLVAILATVIAVIMITAASSVIADVEGLRIRNGLRVHRIGWARVHKFLLRRGDSWAIVLLEPADGSPFEADLDAEQIQLLGIQAHDGERARRAVEELRRLHAQREKNTP